MKNIIVYRFAVILPIMIQQFFDQSKDRFVCTCCDKPVRCSLRMAIQPGPHDLIEEQIRVPDIIRNIIAAAENRCVDPGSAIVFKQFQPQQIGSMSAAYAVGKIGAAVMGAAAEKPEIMSKALPFVALGEGIALFGFLVAIFLLGA